MHKKMKIELENEIKTVSFDSNINVSMKLKNLEEVFNALNKISEYFTVYAFFGKQI